MDIQSTFASEEFAPPINHGFRLTIERDEINRLHLRRYTGPIEVVRDDHGLESALRELKRERIVGFDTETRPAFRKGESYLPSLMQLGGQDKVWVFCLNRLGPLPRLFKLLANPRLVKAGVAMDYDIRRLQELVPFEPAGFCNLEAMTERLGIKKNGLRNLAAIVLGFRLSKGEQRSNWSRDPLSRQQVAYAATDAWVSREIYLKLAEVLDRSGGGDGTGSGATSP